MSSADSRAVRSTAHRRPGGEAVEDLQLVGVAAREQLGEPLTVGEDGRGRGTGSRLGCRRQAERAQHRHEGEVGDVGEQRGGRPAEAGGVGPDRLAHGRGQPHLGVVAPHQRSVEQRVEVLRRGIADRVVAVGGQHQHLEGAERGRVQVVDRALGRRAYAYASGEGGEVRRRRQGEVGPQLQQRRQLLIRAGAQPPGQGGDDRGADRLIG